MTVLHTHFYIVVDTQRGCHTLKIEKENTLSPNVFLWNIGSCFFFGIFNNFYYILPESTIV